MACAADGQYEKAIRQAEKALKCVPRPTGACRSNIYYNLSVWNGIQRKTQAQIDNAKWAYAAQSESLPRIAHYFAVLGRNSRFIELFELCVTLKKKDGAKTRDSWLVKLLYGWEEGLDLFGRAAVEGGDKVNIEFAGEVLRTIVKVANERGDLEGAVFSQYQLGRFHLRYQRDESQVRKAWEKLTDLARNDPHAELYAQQLQCRALAELYLRSGLVAEQATKDSQGRADKRGKQKERIQDEPPDIAKLRALASAKTPTNKNTEYRAEAAALLGYWQRKHGPKRCDKDLFRSRVCQGIQILEDDDPFNDVDGYVILGKALLIAGFVDDAKRVLATAMLVSQASTTDSKQQIPMSLVCHGKPDCQNTDYEKLYICHVCHNTTLCGNCWKMFKDKETGDNGPPYTTCHSSHLFSNVYHKGHKIAEPITVIEGDQLRLDTEWLGALKEKWDISEDTKAAISLTTPKVVMESRRALQLVD
jgi:tetratricopeptide (TPR) repeat protein